MNKTIENKIETLIEEGFSNWAKTNPKLAAAGTGLAGVGLAGINQYMNDGEASSEQITNEPSSYSNEEIQRINDLYNNANERNENYNSVENKKIDRADVDIKNTLNKFTSDRKYGQPSLNDLVEKHASLRQLTQNELIDKRDNLESVLDNTFNDEVQTKQDMQSRLSNEYQKLDSSNLPKDILRKTEIVDNLSNKISGTVPSRESFDRWHSYDVDKANDLTDRILDYGNKEQQSEWVKDMAKQDRISNRIDKNYGKHSELMRDFDNATRDKYDAESEIIKDNKNYENRIKYLNRQYQDKNLSL